MHVCINRHEGLKINNKKNILHDLKTVFSSLFFQQIGGPIAALNSCLLAAIHRKMCRILSDFCEQTVKL